MKYGHWGQFITERSRLPVKPGWFKPLWLSHKFPRWKTRCNIMSATGPFAMIFSERAALVEVTAEAVVVVGEPNDGEVLVGYTCT